MKEQRAIYTTILSVVRVYLCNILGDYVAEIDTTDNIQGGYVDGSFFFCHEEEH